MGADLTLKTAEAIRFAHRGRHQAVFQPWAELDPIIQRAWMDVAEFALGKIADLMEAEHGDHHPGARYIRFWSAAKHMPCSVCGVWEPYRHSPDCRYSVPIAQPAPDAVMS